MLPDALRLDRRDREPLRAPVDLTQPIPVMPRRARAGIEEHADGDEIDPREQGIE